MNMQANNPRNYETICSYFNYEKRRTEYVSILDIVDDVLYERVYAYRFRKSEKTPKAKEIIRINLVNGEMKVSDDLYLSGRFGYFTVFEKRNYGYYTLDQQNTFSTLHKMFNLSFKRHMSQYEKVLQIDEKYAHYLDSFKREFSKCFGTLYHYHQQLQIYPATEYFLKFGLSHLVTDSRALKKAQGDKKFRKYLIDHRDYIKLHYLNYVHIIRAYKLGINITEHKKIKELRSIVSMENKSQVRKILDYLTNKDVKIYVDCINMQNKLGLVIDYYPNDLEKFHDELNSKILEKTHAESAAKHKVKTCFKKTKIGNLQFIPLMSVAEFKEEGRVLKHCVYSSEYYKKEDSLIMSVRDAKSDERVETIEINLREFKLEQARGLENRPSHRHDQIIDAVNKKLMPRIKEMFAAACTGG